MKVYAIILTSFLMILCLGCKSNPVDPDQFNADVALRWNELMMEMAIEEDGLLTLKGVRTQALIFTAMHNALNAIEGRYQSYGNVEENSKADPITAAAQAAYVIAADQYPDKIHALDAELSKWIDLVPENEDEKEGVRLGNSIAQQLLESRTNDAYNGEASYTWHPMAPGVYAEFNQHSGTPEGFIFGAGWAEAQPFLLTSQDQFRSPAPPEINSDAYTEAFNEVKAWGSTESALRTADQAHLAMWWKDFVESSHNRLARELIEKEQLNLWEAARTFALLNMTVYDAYVNVFNNKFHYNHWRPYTAIRWAANDGNPNTEPDEEWNNLHQHTYAFPSYPSAHGTASSAAMIVLSHTLGTGNDYAFTMRTDAVDSAGPFSEKMNMDPPTRSFSSFTDAGWEASLSRVYLGIHFRYDSEEGHRLGNAIGEYANANFLLPLPLDSKND